MKRRKGQKYMNISKLKEQLLKVGERIGLQVEEETANSLTLHAQIAAKDYFDNTVYLRIVTFNSGTLHLFLTFDEIEKTYDNLYLVNAFNDENPWFRAYITNLNDKDYLELHYTSLAIENEQQVVDTIGFLLNELLSENTLKYLKPILESK